MIPSFNQSGVLPPFLPEIGPTHSAAMAPYMVSIVEVAKMFAISPERKGIFLGFLDYRSELRNAGFINGFQWIAGSYLEDCENHRGRAPKDIDIVTFAERPDDNDDKESWKEFIVNNDHLFDRVRVKKQYKCDSFFIDLAIPSEAIVSRTRFWFGLFSHQRETYLWKGILQVPLMDRDVDARDLLNGGATDA